MKKQAMVSINCIAYNHENYIADCIKSFLMQRTSFPFEILIHDDASTDKTPDIIKMYQSKYSDIIKPIYQEENQYSKGVRVSFLNIRRSQSKYIALCEGDDYWTDPNKLQKQVNYMQKHKKCSMCFHAAKIIDAKNDKRIGFIQPYRRDCILTNKKLFFGGGHVVPTASILYKRHLLDNPPSFYFKSPVGDHALALLLSCKGDIGYINEVMSVRRLWVPGSWNTNWHDNTNSLSKQIHYQKMIDTLLDFNEYSEGRWENDLNKIILGYVIQILTLQNHPDPLSSPKVKSLIKHMNYYDRIKLSFKSKAPNVYAILSNIKRKLNNIPLD